MASPDLHDEVILANLSRWKCAALGVFCLALGIPPNLPDFGDGLISYAFYFNNPLGITLRWIFSGFLVIGGALLLAVAAIATFSSPKAVWLVGNEIRWGRLGRPYRLALSSIRAVSFDTTTRMIKLDRRDGGKTMWIATAVLRSEDAPARLMTQVRLLIGQGMS